MAADDLRKRRRSMESPWRALAIVARDWRTAGGEEDLQELRRSVGTAAQVLASVAFRAAPRADHHGEGARAARNQPVQDEHVPTLAQKKARPKPGLHDS